MNQKIGNSGGGGSGRSGQNRRRRGGKSRGRRGRGGQGPNGAPRENSNNTPRVIMTPQERIIERYDTLTELHIQARRKYYDLYHRANPEQRQKLERAFHRTILDLRQYEKSLSPEQFAVLKSKRDGLRMDVTYTTNHQLPPEAPAVPTQGDFEDPHVLQSQIQCDFSNDKEESVGSIDDYKRYKGLE